MNNTKKCINCKYLYQDHGEDPYGNSLHEPIFLCTHPATEGYLKREHPLTGQTERKKIPNECVVQRSPITKEEEEVFCGREAKHWEAIVEKEPPVSIPTRIINLFKRNP